MTVHNAAKADRDNSLRRQLTSFIGIGMFTALIDWGTTMALQFLGVQRELAKVVGWVFGTLAAYLLNSKYTFKAKITPKKAVAVFLLYATTLGIQVFLYWATDAPLQALGLGGVIKDTIAFVIAQGVATITNFVLQRTVVFKDRKPTHIIEDVRPN